ncbi:glycosyltransferase family 2 protein [Arcobacter sp.]|uniref:glycosyltransferase family 2 protein n=1 Tax=Arcobacter sp. TaxID=1872629 RepID=UPI003D104B84
MNNPKITIGMPVYNGEKYLNTALKSLLTQTYTNFELIISDNDSSDKTSSICKEYAEIDNRIKYIKQKNNIGALKNFEFVLKKSSCDYFMWAACDDIWDNTFIENCMNVFSLNKNLGYVFCNIHNININYKKYREIPSFVKYSGEPSFKKIARYLYDAEFNGKANLFYGLYKKQNLIHQVKYFSNTWGSDMNFNLLTLCLNETFIIDKILFKKMNPNDVDYFTYKDDIFLRNKLQIKEFKPYYIESLKCTFKTKFFPLVFVIMTYRFIELLLIKLYLKYKNK